MPTIINGDGVVTAGGTASTQGRLVLAEQTGSGTNTVTIQAPATLAADLTFTMPTADGTNGQVLQTNGSGQLSFTTPASPATPFSVIGNSTAGSEIRLPEDTDNGSNYVALKAPNSLASNLTLTLPTADGTSGQVLQTDGAGQLSFATAPSGSLILVQTVTGSGVDTIDITGNFTSTYRIYKLYITASFSASTQVSFRFYINGSLITSATTGWGGAYAGSGLPSFSSSSGVTTAVAGSLSAKVNTFELTFFNPSDSNSRAPVYVVATGATDASSSYFNGQFFNATTGTAGTRAITGIQASTGGTNGTWTAKLYGIKE